MEPPNAMQSLRGCRREDRHVVAEIVNMLRKRDICGTKGPWKSFLAGVDKVLTASRDPYFRSWTILTSFLETIIEEKSILMVEQFYSWIMHKQKTEDCQLIKNRLPITPEDELVRKTQAHPRFQQDYNFESYNEGWIHIEGGTARDQSTPENLLGIDCEMVDCEGETHEVVRVCLVDRNLKTLIDTLVRPSKSVLDYKSHITGVSARDLEGITVTQTDVQEQVKELLVPGSIVVGHSLHNDLKALKIDHRRLIDTQFIFQIQDRSPLFMTGLRDLCKGVLGYDFRKNDKPHDCLEDAKIPIMLVLHHLQHGSSSLKLPHDVNESLLSKLLLHKVPDHVRTIDLLSLFPNFSCEIQDAEKRGKAYSGYTSMYAVFKNKEDANNAFAQLQGFIGKDITGRLQKEVFYNSRMLQINAAKVKLMVRKMGFKDSDTKQGTTLDLKNSGPQSVSKLSKLSESAGATKIGKKDVVEDTCSVLELQSGTDSHKRSQRDLRDSSVHRGSTANSEGGTYENVKRRKTAKKLANQQLVEAVGEIL